LKEAIRVRGAREHNLKSIEVGFPKRKITVVSGVSGSGKSTLAFDVLYSEGQRRYVECVSTYAKQFLERVPRPDVDSIEGLCPALAIRSTGGSRSARSTVGTSTEIYDYLRLLFARIGMTYCASCGAPVSAEAAKEIARQAMREPGALVLVGFPMQTADRSAGDIAEELVSQGFLRLYDGGELISLDESPPGEATLRSGEVIVIVDRLKARPGVERRLVDSIELAFSKGRGTLCLVIGDGEPRRFSKGLTCDRCGAKCAPPTPLLFSFNSPAGACPTCRGFGNTLEFSVDLIVPDKSLTIEEGAVIPWAGEWRSYFMGKLRGLEKRGVLRLDVPFGELSHEEVQVVLYGCKGLTGIIAMLERFKTKSYKKSLRFIVKKYQIPVECPDCHGTRLRPEALTVKLGGRTIADVNAMSIEDALSWTRSLDLTAMERAIGGRVLEEISSRLSTMLSLGAGYLTLNRLTRSLSSGEVQRIELAGAIGSRLADTLYVLDEPTVGLHPRDTSRLISALEGLKESGNTVVVVEHDREVIESADWIVDLGPGAGRDGGDLVCQCRPVELRTCAGSLTGKHLALGVGSVAAVEGPEVAPSGREPRRGKERGRGIHGASLAADATEAVLRVRGARANNLKSIDVDIPLGRMVSVTGVSGAGKSSLVEEVLYPECLRALGAGVGAAGACDGVEGLDRIDDVVLVDRSPIGKSPRSNAVTYLKAFDGIRKIFAALPLSRARGFTPGTFSFNTPGGRCESCGGEGRVKVEMYFLADLWLDCEECAGARYHPDVLEVKFKGMNIKDVLDLTVDEAITAFSDYPEVGRRLWLLQRVGLGYIGLGQPAPTLSGGEAQRVKIARELARGRGDHILYILAEPTIGLHFADIARLVSVLRELVDRGNTVLMVEHNLDVIALSDWVIDLGPGAGELEGGRLVAQGPPESVVACEGSATGAFLAGALEPLGSRPRERRG
jgi:excinuclease ABC subunit A